MALSEGMITYEGDPKLKLEKIKGFPENTVRLTKLHFGLHSGTHVDAPAHFLPDGDFINDVPLDSLIGKAIVCDLTSVSEVISEKDLQDCDIKSWDIVLLKTTNSELLSKPEFNRKFVHLSDDAADYLVEKRIKAVGIDYLSIEKFRSKTKHVHKTLLSNKIPIIEGLDLTNASAGEYTLYCLPLKITGVEAAPARCILVK